MHRHIARVPFQVLMRPVKTQVLVVVVCGTLEGDPPDAPWTVVFPAERTLEIVLLIPDGLGPLSVPSTIAILSMIVLPQAEAEVRDDFVVLVEVISSLKIGIDRARVRVVIVHPVVLSSRGATVHASGSIGVRIHSEAAKGVGPGEALWLVLRRR